MKTYNRIVIIATCLMVGFCAGLIIWAQPLNGDLTRVGAYPERWYGWREPQQKTFTGARRFFFRNRLLASLS